MEIDWTEIIKFALGSVQIRLVCTHAEPIQIMDLYFEFSKEVEGTAYNGMPVKGRQYMITLGNLMITIYSPSAARLLTFRHKLADAITDDEIKELAVVVVTNKYGKMSSAQYKVSAP